MSAQQQTHLVGLIGWPVEHSVSPAMFNAAFQTLGMDWQYETFSTRPDQLTDVIRDLKARRVRGLNVTIPHKQAIMTYLDIIQPQAKTIGAVNTITVIDDESRQWRGENTDAIGFYRDLTANAPDLPADASALILGAGGAAHAAASVLARLNYQTYIASRNPSQGLNLIRSIQSGMATSNAPTSSNQIESTQWRMRMRAIPWNRIGSIAGRVDLIVNCTPAGMWPKVDVSPWPADVPFPAHAVLYDMIYRPQITRLMQTAQDAGAKAIGGLGMLVQQGAAAFQLWTEREAPVQVMEEAAKQAVAHV